MDWGRLYHWTEMLSFWWNLYHWRHRKLLYMTTSNASSYENFAMEMLSFWWIFLSLAAPEAVIYDNFQCIQLWKFHNGNVEIVITGCTGSCHNDNYWWKFRQMAAFPFQWRDNALPQPASVHPQTWPAFHPLRQPRQPCFRTRVTRCRHPRRHVRWPTSYERSVMTSRMWRHTW